MAGSSSSATGSEKSTKSRRLFSFDEARRIARGHGFDSKEEFLEYTCPGAYQIPKDAHVVWKEDWRGWEDFLGVCLSFEKGQQVASALKGIETEEDYLNLIKSKTILDNDIASRLPYRPDLKYKNEWLGWDDFLMANKDISRIKGWDLDWMTIPYTILRLLKDKLPKTDNVYGTAMASLVCIDPTH
eukprot:CAMPEP_0201901034 /NCGR_PEP_ID=MMETSP0902-20130614/53520_1 /ASSEMBLY_ACC=CAM_ASM_000551 /TAXON_ID=420261 /ORGANISM="Thalassiosira antarctica, Strain CCMP982" /LENGTH=185 /DNA_ID=CAMNT_0048434871 /DNA_START=138 /DNA_END=696 /DNA_ORIENTATION=-